MSVLNIVYDEWDEVTGGPLPNLQSIYGENRFRTVTGFFMFYNMLNEINSCKLEDVYANPKKSYYYFINGINDIYNTIKMNNNIIPLPEKVETCFVECPNFNIVFLNEHEYETEECIVLLDTIVKEKGYDGTKMYMVNNNSKLDFYKYKYKTPINLHALDFLPQINGKNLDEFGVPNFVAEKENLFMSHNRSVKAHRYALLSMLKKFNMLDQVDWSLVMGWERKRVVTEISSDIDFYLNIFTEDEIKELRSELDYLEAIEIKKSKYEEDHTWFDIFGNHNGIDWGKVFEYKTYENSYVNITTESCYFLNEIHITDKSVKPMYFYQLPIFLASQNHVQTLRDRYKFDVFDDIINHEYDLESDNKRRFHKIFKEIQRVNKNKDKIIKFYKKNEERFYNNRMKVLDIKNSTKDITFFKSLMNK
jgi:hypothetical protein